MATSKLSNIRPPSLGEWTCFRRPREDLLVLLADVACVNNKSYMKESFPFSMNQNAFFNLWNQLGLTLTSREILITGTKFSNRNSVLLPFDVALEFILQHVNRPVKLLLNIYDLRVEPFSTSPSIDIVTLEPPSIDTVTLESPSVEVEYRSRPRNAQTGKFEKIEQKDDSEVKFDCCDKSASTDEVSLEGTESHGLSCGTREGEMSHKISCEDNENPHKKQKLDVEVTLEPPSVDNDGIHGNTGELEGIQVEYRSRPRNTQTRKFVKIERKDGSEVKFDCCDKSVTALEVSLSSLEGTESHRLSCGTRKGEMSHKISCEDNENPPKKQKLDVEAGNSSPAGTENDSSLQSIYTLVKSFLEEKQCEMDNVKKQLEKEREARKYAEGKIREFEAQLKEQLEKELEFRKAEEKKVKSLEEQLQTFYRKRQSANETLEGIKKFLQLDSNGETLGKED